MAYIALLLAACGLPHIKAAADKANSSAVHPVPALKTWRDKALQISSTRVLVRLCHEAHRDSVSQHVRRSHASVDAPHFRAVIERHLKHLGRLPALVLSETTTAAIDELREMRSRVCGIEPLGRVSMMQTSFNQAIRPIDGVFWHVDRLNGPIDGSGAHREQLTGHGVNVFILDTGLDAAHPDFVHGKRSVANVASFADSPQWQYRPEWGWTQPPANQADLANNDYNGHGTHCAGDCCGNSTGAAPAANIFSIKVLDNDGAGFADWIFAGLDAISELKSGALANEPVIVSLSLGAQCLSGDPSVCANQGAYADAIASLDDLGIVTIAAAGNDGDDACFYLPAAVSQAITVGATDINDEVAWFSNYGSCIDLMAPGVNIPSTASSLLAPSTSGLFDDSIYYILSGTSMAAPGVAGVLAQFVEAVSPVDGDVRGAANAMMHAAASGELSFSNNVQAGDSCVSNDLLARTPGQDSTVLDTSDFETADCKLPDERDPSLQDDFDFWIDDDADDQADTNLDEYGTADVGFCLSTLDAFEFATSPEMCWSRCRDRYGPDTIISVDYYAPYYCYCQNACECMLKVEQPNDDSLPVEGSTLVVAGYELPAPCDEAFDQYQTEIVGVCNGNLNQVLTFSEPVDVERCWAFCVDFFGDQVVAVDHYSGITCVCRNACTECVPTANQGTLFVPADFLPPCLDEPSVPPTHNPTVVPTVKPTVPATSPPTLKPTMPATTPPTLKPTIPATSPPTLKPTMPATSPPTLKPTMPPTRTPTHGLGTTTPMTQAPSTDRPTMPRTDIPTQGPTTTAPMTQVPSPESPITPPSTSEPQTAPVPATSAPVTQTPTMNIHMTQAPAVIAPIPAPTSVSTADLVTSPLPTTSITADFAPTKAPSIRDPAAIDVASQERTNSTTITDSAATTSWYLALLLTASVTVSLASFMFV